MLDNKNILSVQFEKTDDGTSDKFIKMKLWIANIGENYNASYFSKEVLTNMSDSLPYTPLTGFIGKNKFDETDFRGHEEDLVRKVDPDTGEIDYEFKYLGFAYGFVPLDPEWNFETKLCPDGITREYLTCTVLVWKKWSDVIDIFERDGWSKKHSMELSDCEGYIDEEDKLFHFTSAVFDGLCVLGEDVEPGIPYSNIEKFNFKRFNKQLKTMIEEYNDYFFSTSNKGGEKQNMNDNFLKKEDWGTGDEIDTDLSKDAASDDSWGDVDKTSLRNDILKASNYKSLVSDCYIIVEDGWEDSPSSNLKYPICQIKDGKLVYNINGVQAALQRLHQEGIESGSAIDKLKKIYRKLSLDTSNFKKEGNSLSKKDIAANFKLTAGQLFDEFNRVLSEVTYKTEDWWSGTLVDCPRFWPRDYDESYVYVVDRANDCMDMKLPYTTEGDNIKIDYENASRIKYTPTDWDGGTEDDPDYDNDVVIDTVQDYAKKVIEAAKQELESVKTSYADKVSEFEVKLSEKEETLLQLNEKYTLLSADLAEKDAKIQSLEQFSKEVEDAKNKEKVDALFTKYSVYFKPEEVEELREKQSTYEKFELFEKEVKSIACDRLVEATKENKPLYAFTEIPKAEVDVESEQHKDVWARLDN